MSDQKPKKPDSAYQIFRDEQSKILAQNSTEVSSSQEKQEKIQNAWRQLSEEEQANYTALQNQQREQYEKSLREYQEKHPENSHRSQEQRVTRQTVKAQNKQVQTTAKVEEENRKEQKRPASKNKYPVKNLKQHEQCNGKTVKSISLNHLQNELDRVLEMRQQLEEDYDVLRRANRYEWLSDSFAEKADNAHHRVGDLSISIGEQRAIRQQFWEEYNSQKKRKIVCGLKDEDLQNYYYICKRCVITEKRLQNFLNIVKNEDFQRQIGGQPAQKQQVQNQNHSEEEEDDNQ